MRAPLFTLLASSASLCLLASWPTDAASQQEERSEQHGQPGQDAQHDPLVPIATLTRAHRDREALDALARLDEARGRTAEVLYLKGRLLERLGEAGPAAEAFAGARSAGADGSLPAWLVADGRRRRARLLVRAGDCQRATVALSELAVEGSLGALPRALLAECALMSGRHAEAAVQLRRVVAENGNDVDTFAARLHLAEALESAGDRDAAAAALHEALVRRPEHPDAPLAERRLAAWGPVVFSAADRVARARRLLDRRQPTRALEELDAIPDAERPSGRGRAVAAFLHLRGMALFKTRHHYEEAAAVLRAAADADPRSPTATEDAFHAARALSRADHDIRAINAYREFARAHPRGRRASDATYLAAWLELRHGRPRGEANMRRFIDGRHGARQPGRRRSAIFELGLRAFERRRFSRAATLFARYAEGGGGPMKAGKGKYWLGRALERAGRRGAAVAALRQARALSPLHWYGQLAGARLRALGANPGPAIPPGDGPAQRPTLPSPQIPIAARTLARLGLTADAAAIVTHDRDGIRNAAPRGRRSETLVAAYSAVGATKAAFRVAAAQHDALGHAPGPNTRWAWSAAYPRPFANHVRAAAAAHDLPAAYLWATMRQESAFDSDAISHADAIGLLQLLPRNARRRARRLQVPFTRELLFHPQWNIRFGAAEIAEHAARYDGVYPLSIAAYNAGHHRVNGWLRDRGQTELDLFVERIPFDETRRYVRRVYSHYVRYRYLDDPASVEDLRLPERVGPQR